MKIILGWVFIISTCGLLFSGFDKIPSKAHNVWQSTVQVRCISYERHQSHPQTEYMGNKKHPQRHLLDNIKYRRRIMVGSGIVVGINRAKRQALIVTSRHSLKNINGSLQRLEVRFPAWRKGTSRRERLYKSRFARVVLEQPGKDLVYLMAAYPKKVTPVVASLKDIDKQFISSDKLLSIGFPSPNSAQTRFYNISATPTSAKNLIWFSQGELLLKGVDASQVHVLVHTAPLLKGNSGGPLVNQMGEVVGINCMIFTRRNRKSPSNSFRSFPRERLNQIYVAVSSSEVLKDLQLINDSESEVASITKGN